MDDNNPYQPQEPAHQQPQPWEQNQNQHQGHHEGHHPHHGHHHDHHDQHGQPHNPSFEPYQSAQPEQPAQPDVYPTHIPPEVLEMHKQYAKPIQPEPQPVAQQYAPPEQYYAPPAAPAAPEPFQQSLPADDINPVAVVQALSVRGVEYWMMTMTLYLGAAGILGILLALVNGGASFEILSFPVALLIVCLPVFSYLFLRLKKAELMNPKLRLDPSKRKLTQFTQFITFAICLFDIIGVVFAIIASVGGHGFGSMWKYLLNSLIVLLVAGGILYYYWNDEHRSRS